MNEKQLLNKLHLFYSLELNQVDLYTAQAHSMKDTYLIKTFERISAIEQQHVDNIAAEIRKRGAEPTKLGDVLSPLMGKAAGTFLGTMGLKMVLKADIALEEKAMKDYKALISQVHQNSHIFKVLWSNCIDEDLHTQWFINRLQELEK